MIATRTTLARLTDPVQSRNLITSGRRYDDIGHLTIERTNTYTRSNDCGRKISERAKA